MKKLKILLIAIFLFIPAKVLGYGIENYYVNATVEKNGDLEVEEYFEMNGDFNGMERIIKYRNSSAYTFNPDANSYGGHNLHNGNGMVVEEVRAVDIDSNFDFKNINGTIFNRVDYGNKGDYGIYTDKSSYDGRTVKIFLPSSKNKAFYIKYKLHNMAILHNDVGELGWNIFGTELSESIGNLTVYINVPNNKNIKVWAHGPLNGTSEILSSEKVKISISGLDNNTAIDARITFDKDVIVNSSKKSNVNALDKIIRYETDQAERANELRRQSDERYTGYIESSLKRLEQEPSRNNYDQVENYIYQLNNSDKKSEYYEKLYTFKPKVDKYEYKIFKSYLSDSSIKKHNYDKAKEIINNVFDIRLKEKMYNELDSYYKKLKAVDYKIEISLTIISICTLVISLIVYYKPIKMKKHVDPLYFRDIPSDLSPAAVGILVDKEINKNEVSASILDLVRRKVVKIEKQNNKSYDFVLNTNYEELSEADKNLVLLLFPSKTATRVNSKKIRRITNTKFTKYKESIIDELEEKKLMKDYVPALSEINGVLFEIGLIFAFSPLFPIGYILMLLYAIMRYHQNFPIWILKMINFILIVLSIILTSTVIHITLFVGIIVIIWISRILKRLPIKLNIRYTDEGREEYKKWHGLRNFLIDFSKINDKEIQDVTLWEKYLVYATALGVGEKVLKQIKVKIEQLDNIDYTVLNDMMTIDYISSSISRISNNVVTQSLPSVSFPIASAIASSGGSYSSGSGGGGGFSGGYSGGGSFGGGGGGGRF